MTLTRDALIGIIVLAVVVLGIVWYVATRPVPVAPVQTATTTPTGTTAAGPQSIEDHEQYYDVDTQYPGSTALAGLPDSADVDAVALMKQWETDTIAQFKSDSGLDNLTAQDIQTQGLGPDRKYALTITYETHSSPHTVSYVFQIFEDTLGAHPNTTYKTFTFDTTNGQELSLAQIFTSADYATTLSTLARAKLPAQIAAAEQTDVSGVDMDMLDAGTTADPANFQDFYFDGNDLVVLFPPYAVGPYVLGLVKLDVPASEVSGLKTQYP